MVIGIGMASHSEIRSRGLAINSEFAQRRPQGGGRKESGSGTP